MTDNKIINSNKDDHIDISNSVSTQTEIDVSYNQIHFTEEKNIIKDNNYPKNVYFKEIFNRRKLIKESIVKNNFFWIISIICVSLLSVSKYVSLGTNIWYCICGFITYCLTIILGYFSHYISHYNNFSEIYQIIINEGFKFDINTTFHKSIQSMLDFTMDYHDIYHHNSEINKQPLYLVLEILNNIWMQGGCWILYVYVFSMNVNIYILLLWSLVYSTFHNINYNIIDNTLIHNEHHKNIFTNFGIDIVDLIFNSKYDDRNIENINHYSINLVIITALLLYYKWNDK